jgi:hypothetical protein
VVHSDPTDQGILYIFPKPYEFGVKFINLVLGTVNDHRCFLLYCPLELYNDNSKKGGEMAKTVRVGRALVEIGTCLQGQAESSWQNREERGMARGKEAQKRKKGPQGLGRPSRHEQV